MAPSRDTRETAVVVFGARLELPHPRAVVQKGEQATLRSYRIHRPCDDDHQCHCQPYAAASPDRMFQHRPTIYARLMRVDRRTIAWLRNRPAGLPCDRKPSSLGLLNLG
jgi:hypothetical protein